MRIGLVGYVDCAHALEGRGLCESLHGHTYRVEALLEHPKHGASSDLEALQKRFQEKLLDFDHCHLNSLMKLPSCENFCLLLFESLKASQPGLLRLKVWEGEGKWAEFDSRA